MNFLFRLLITQICCVAMAIPVVAQVNDNAIAYGAAIGNTPEVATREAYYAAFKEELSQALGDQASGTAGEKFKRQFQIDFDSFKKRYFSPDTISRCVPEGVRFSCEVDGSIDLAAVRIDAAKAVASTGQSRSYTFIVSSAESTDPRTNFVVDQLAGKFAVYNHRILFGHKAEKAIAGAKADFSLAIYETNFTDFRFDTYRAVMNGALTVRFRLLDMANSEALAITPTFVMAEVPGNNSSVLRQQLVAELSNKAAIEIARVVNSEISTYASRAAKSKNAETRSRQGLKSYTLRVLGSTRRTAEGRARLKNIRDVLSIRLGFTNVQTNFASSTDKQTVLNFDAAKTLSPDDLVDALYAQFSNIESFQANYFGGNDYEVTF